MKHQDRLHLLVLFVIFLICSLCYYAGEIAAVCGSARLPEFFYGVHDIHRMLFMLPIFYAAYYFGSRAVLIVTIISVCVFVPRALLISPFPDPLARTLVFGLAAGFLAWVVAHLRHQVAVLSQRNATLIRNRESRNGRITPEQKPDGHTKSDKNG